MNLPFTQIIKFFNFVFVVCYSTHLSAEVIVNELFYKEKTGIYQEYLQINGSEPILFDTDTGSRPIIMTKEAFSNVTKPAI